MTDLVNLHIWPLIGRFQTLLAFPVCACMCARYFFFVVHRSRERAQERGGGGGGGTAISGIGIRATHTRKHSAQMTMVRAVKRDTSTPFFVIRICLDQFSLSFSSPSFFLKPLSSLNPLHKFLSPFLPRLLFSFFFLLLPNKHS